MTQGLCCLRSHANKSLHCRPSNTQVEDVLQLSEELALAELPDDFQATALRELEQEACTQLTELLQNVLRLDEITLAAAEAVANGPPGGGASGGGGGGAGRGAHSAVLALDQRLEDASALLGLLDTFSHWCEKTMATTLPSPAPPPPIIAAAAAPVELDPEAVEAVEAPEAAEATEATEATSASPRAPAATSPSTPPRPPSGAAAQPTRLVRPVARSEARQRLEAYVQGVASVYLHAEGTWLHGAVGVAVSSDEVADETAPDGPVLSLVDDAFYVLLKSFQRAIQSGHVTHVVVPLLSQIVDAARQRCVPALHDRMREAGAADAGNSAFIAAVNSLEYAAHNADRLRQVVQDALFSRQVDGEAEADGSEAEGLAALATLSSDFSDRAAEATAQLADALMPTAWLLLDFGPADFVLDEAKEIEQQSSFDLKLLQPLAATLRALQHRLRRANMSAVTRRLALVLSERIEQAVMQKRFNELGAMLLSELVQQLSDTLSEPSGSVRQELGRLRQLVFMLNVGSLSEAAGLGLSGVGSSLSREELCDILARRIEFDEGDVRDVLLA